MVSSSKAMYPPNCQPTQRAPDAGDSAQISGSFLRLIIFLAGRLRRPRPSAGNANRQCALALNLLGLFQKLSFVQVGFESSKLGFGFSKKFWFVQVGSFSGGEFPNLVGFKTGSRFLFKQFRVKFAQVSKIGFKVFSQSSGKQAVSFCKVCFFQLVFFWAKSGFQNWLHFFSKSFGKFESGFFVRFIFLGKLCFGQNQFLAKVLASPRLWRFGKSISFSKIKSGL